MKPGTQLERLARLEEQMEFVRSTVADIRTTQVEMRDTFIGAKANLNMGRALLGGAKLVLSGGVGAGLLTAVQHLAKVVAVAILLMPAPPAYAWGTPGDDAYPVVRWQLEVTACRGPVCRERRRDTWSGAACGTAAEAVHQRKPAGVTVRTTCVETRSAARSA